MTMQLNDRCSTHQRNPQAGRCETCNRIKREERIALRLVSDALKAGYAVSVCDGEEWVLKRSRDRAAIKSVMFSTDEEILSFWRGEEKVGRVWLIYGNDTDLISDYSANDETEALVAGAQGLADSLA